MRRKYRLFLVALLCIIAIFIGLSANSSKNTKYGEKSKENDESLEKSVCTVNYSVDTNESVNTDSTLTDNNRIIPVGEPVGIYLKTDGVLVTGFGDIETKGSKVESPCKGYLKKGDFIISINNEPVTDKTELVRLINSFSNDSDNLTIGLIREGEEIYVPVKPVVGKDDRYMLGLWVKDDVSGIGTVSFIKDGYFYALGHGISDTDTGKIFMISDGAIFPTDIINIRKPTKNTPGRIEGLIDYDHQIILGRIMKNKNQGISGVLTDSGSDRYKEYEAYEMGRSEDVSCGKAYIMSSIIGTPRLYEIEIIKKYDYDPDNNMEAGMEIRVVDENLLNLTGGIIQGLSGSPILQNNKVIGAVTHVFVDDPTMGYGIFIDGMVSSN